MSMLKRAQPASDEGYHSWHVMLQIEMGAAGHESQRHTLSTGGTVSRLSFYVFLWFNNIRYVLISCVLSLLDWLRRAQKPRSTEGADEEERVGQTSERYREVILQVLQYLSISYMCPHSYTPCIVVLPFTFLSDAVARLAGFRPTAKVQEALWKILPASPTGVQPVHMRSEGHTPLSTCPIVPWFSLNQGARPGKATARAEGKRRAWRARVLGGAHSTYWPYWHISRISILY